MDKVVIRLLIQFMRKESLVRVCGHYVFSDAEFLDEIKVSFGIDQLIKNNVKQKLISLHKNINL